MKIELTEKMIFAISVAFDELSNSGDWCDYLEEKELDDVYEGIEQIKKLVDFKKEIS